jgi:hypothetical protein
VATSIDPTTPVGEEDFSGDTDNESNGGDSDIQEIPLINLVTPQSTQAQV